VLTAVSSRLCAARAPYLLALLPVLPLGASASGPLVAGLAGLPGLNLEETA
jgi:hypothetical protein